METLKVYQMMAEIREMTLEVQSQIFTVGDVFDPMPVMNEIEFNYSAWEITVSPGNTANVGHFIAVWTHYKNTTYDQLARAAAALEAEYDPVSNYDLIESESDGRKLSTETDTTTPTGGTVTTVNRYGINSSGDGAPYDKTTVAPATGAQTSTTISYAGDKTITDNDGNTQSGYHDAHDRYLRRKGNIGIQTAADMILREMEVRKLNLLKEWVHTFFATYGFTIGGV